MFFTFPSFCFFKNLIKSLVYNIPFISSILSSYTEKGSDRSATVLKCLELKQKLLLEDLNVTKDDSNALNVAFTAMSREDFEALGTVEVHQGGNSTELGADFGVSDDTDSFEARLKADAKQRLKELQDKKEEGNS